MEVCEKGLSDHRIHDTSDDYLSVTQVPAETLSKHPYLRQDGNRPTTGSAAEATKGS